MPGTRERAVSHPPDGIGVDLDHVSPETYAQRAPSDGKGQQPSVPPDGVRWSHRPHGEQPCQRWLVQFTQAPRPGRS